MNLVLYNVKPIISPLLIIGFSYDLGQYAPKMKIDINLKAEINQSSSYDIMGFTLYST